MSISTSNRFEILSSLQSIVEEIEPNTCVSSSPEAIRGTRPSRVKKTVTPENHSHTNTAGNTITVENNANDKAIVDYIKGDTDDKYSLMLTTKSKFKSYKPALSECKTTEKWDSQNKIKFFSLHSPG